eukprot:CAMPEP_0202941366 /NCGR_PEP_ID=MMETSP1395-20130829/1481_1 /ASSEMBLY_ACC=CAM_ASM_000871 /TAXON_ID=5961 /ORGANISM="Blepharisma japonicum, Strain Stock R1072" /LENGTH=66 /DNA_ID=CAMNT_0049636507 /DNA_START=363 /DNA_END=563 /DNA_ORIENTATION=+
MGDLELIVEIVAGDCGLFNFLNFRFDPDTDLTLILTLALFPVKFSDGKHSAGSSITGRGIVYLIDF